MKKTPSREELLLEFATLATEEDLSRRMEYLPRLEEISNTLQMTEDAILREATLLAIATFK